MKRFYVIRISYFLMFFVLGISLFSISLVFGAKHAVYVSSLPSKTPCTVILDAGHGGEDGGAIGANGALEKDINLSIALYIEEQLENAGLNVKMIRNTDTSVGDSSLSTIAERKRSDIQYRTEYVNNQENAILISIHQNFFEQSQYSGAQMFYSDNHSDSILLAESIRKSIVDSLQPENHRENKLGNGIYLLDHANVPAVIVECGFISNPDEANRLNSTKYQEKIAQAISEGIIRFTRGE